MVLLLAAALLLPTSPGWAADAEGWTVGWKNGFRFESPDKKLKLKFGGRIQADFTFADPDAAVEAAFGPIEDGSEFRRARLYFSGTIYENIEFKAQYDFAGSKVAVKDLYLGFLDTPVGNIRVGHFKEPFSIEELTSSKYTTFLERSLPNVFAPSRNTGVMSGDHRGERFTWAVGAFRETDDGGISDGDGKLNLTGRITGLPIYANGGSRLLHLGLGYTRKDLEADSFRFRQRPEVHQTLRFVDTKSFAADSVSIASFELAAVTGPFWLMAELMLADVDAGLLGDPSFSGGHVQAGFFLTGENRNYKTSAAAFDRLTPRRSFARQGKEREGGIGAWEIAVRYSTLDLTGAGLAGGELDDITFALNWYPNPATRVMLNYVIADADGVGDSRFLLLRFQVDF